MRRLPPISPPRVGLVLLVVALVLAPVVPAVGAAAMVPDARLTISDVSTAPTAPTAGEPVTVSPTVSLSAGSAATVEIERVELRNDSTTLARAVGPGSLSQGDSLTVGLVTEFTDPGRKDLTLVAVGNSSTENDTVRIERPLSLVVRDAPPRLEVTAPDPVGNPLSNRYSASGFARDTRPIQTAPESVTERTALTMPTHLSEWI